MAWVRRLLLKILSINKEHKEQAEILTAMGCDLAQAYYFGRPAPAKNKKPDT
jgi:EAL domain-containing protein (putative c-di-GMP-specific phosphodiesterase class I)